jgi:hypothetical protein
MLTYEIYGSKKYWRNSVSTEFRVNLVEKTLKSDSTINICFLFFSKMR